MKIIGKKLRNNGAIYESTIFGKIYFGSFIVIQKVIVKTWHLYNTLKIIISRYGVQTILILFQLFTDN